jgi:hypothetical protein
VTAAAAASPVGVDGLGKVTDLASGRRSCNYSQLIQVATAKDLFTGETPFRYDASIYGLATKSRGGGQSLMHLCRDAELALVLAKSSLEVFHKVSLGLAMLAEAERLHVSIMATIACLSDTEADSVEPKVTELEKMLITASAIPRMSWPLLGANGCLA